ncbi:MAG: hypothetical protein AVDCRST_MAG17-854, partial [uncultured Solirubrobacterales bacterium]
GAGSQPRSRGQRDAAGAALGRRARTPGRHGVRRSAGDSLGRPRGALSGPAPQREPVGVHQLRGRGVQCARPPARAARARV